MTSQTRCSTYHRNRSSLSPAGRSATASGPKQPKHQNDEDNQEDDEEDDAPQPRSRQHRSGQKETKGEAESDVEGGSAADDAPEDEAGGTGGE